ncbi:MAG: DUF5063 domain-containing protein [Pseudomonadota bacterium]
MAPDDAAIDAFATEARRFVDWVNDETNSWAPKDALKRLVDLYRSALVLPEGYTPELPDEDHGLRISDDECRRVAEHASQLPLDFYGEVFDSTVLPPEAPVIGHLQDDFSDIYRDVATGLRLFDLGRRAEARWEWSFNFSIHWGEHATSAIRALHGYLSQSGFKDERRET